jgi:hypothetical protein
MNNINVHISLKQQYHSQPSIHQLRTTILEKV